MSSKAVVLLIVIMANGLLTGCLAQSTLRESAARNDALSDKYRSPNADELDLHWSKAYREQAEQDRRDSNKLSIADEFFGSLMILSFDALIGNNNDKSPNLIYRP
ncbi:MAG: hypothetical protein JWM78_280 [Verrucomicrobiaceae bacterium]|nr:hypothetical protein [Verrucomicrobiaceae bacterium]